MNVINFDLELELDFHSHKLILLAVGGWMAKKLETEKQAEKYILFNCFENNCLEIKRKNS